jgi:hypothetical protein
MEDGSARAASRCCDSGESTSVWMSPAPEPLDSTRILVRRGDVTVGDRVRQALGVGKVVLARDSTLLLDASVLLGRDFSARHGFHP